MPEVIDCIAEGRPPSDEELFRVADHKDLLGSRAAFAWGRAPDDAALTLRAAQAGLNGRETYCNYKCSHTRRMTRLES
jgi:hypothetical protein